MRLATSEPLGSTIRMPNASIARIDPLTWPFHRGSGGGPRSSWGVASTLLTEPALQPLDPFFHPLFSKNTELNCILTAEFSQYLPVLDGRFWSASHIGLIKLFRNFLSMGLGALQSSHGSKEKRLVFLALLLQGGLGCSFLASYSLAERFCCWIFS